MPSTPPEQSDIETLAAAARRKPAVLIAKKRRLLKNLQGDLDKHGDPDQWKRYGDLLLANVGTAERRGDTIIVTDYFDDALPQVEVPGEYNKGITDIAEEYFRRYAKARNGLAVINERIADALKAIDLAEERLAEIETVVQNEDPEALVNLTAPTKPKPPVLAAQGRKPKSKTSPFTGARRFTSSDGFEILVGKKAADNDFLTFRVARSLDTWLHAADYPGSHVVIRSAGKKEMPQRTLIEAAQLAAFYSDARQLDKAAVNYTLKKFVNKPRRSAPGLVSLASHRSILVEPQVPFEKPDE